jgi:ribosome maturation factor RimP
MGPTERVRELVEPLLPPELELVDVELSHGVLRLSLDRPGGIDLEAIAEASHVVSAVLDEADPIPEPYQLEVSSPGLERPLRTPEHFQRFVGSQITLRTHPGTSGERRMTGELSAADDTVVDVRTEDGTSRRVAYADIERARTVFEWGPAPKPGQGRKSRKSRPAGQSSNLPEEATP